LISADLNRPVPHGAAKVSDRKLWRPTEADRGNTKNLLCTFEQDPKYAIRLLVDIAIKALSPAINDPATAVRAIDQIEDLLYRLGMRDLDAGYARDANGVLRVIFPMPTWEDYLRLSFDEIRQYGASSVQVMRRLRAALSGVAEAITSETRMASVQAYVKHLDLAISRSPLDTEDRLVASQEDPQGLGLSRSPMPLRIISDISHDH